MAEPIYKIFMGRFLEAWYQLSEEEQNSLTAKLDEALEKVGAKRPILCDTNWSSDQWSVGGIEEFPSIEAVQNKRGPSGVKLVPILREYQRIGH